MLTREVYEKGQIVIPKNVREMVGFYPKTEVVFSVEDDRVILRKYKSVAKDFEEIAKRGKGKAAFDRMGSVADRMKRMGL